jgi:hypothetical protein
MYIIYNYYTIYLFIHSLLYSSYSYIFINLFYLFFYFLTYFIIVYININIIHKYNLIICFAFSAIHNAQASPILLASKIIQIMIT